MFWKKKPRTEHTRSQSTVASTYTPEIPVQNLGKAAEALALSLKDYSEAAHEASYPDPDGELVAAREKVAAARQLVVKGRIAYALGQCIPEHVEHWPAWSRREDFREWVHFNATQILAREHGEDDGNRKIAISTIEFIFNGSRYRLVLSNLGMSYAPTLDLLGDIEFWLGEQLVAKLGLVKDLRPEHPMWEFSEVRALKVGSWMKDVIDIATQIEAGRHKWANDIHDNQTLETAKNIDFGQSE